MAGGRWLIGTGFALEHGYRARGVHGRTPMPRLLRISISYVFEVMPTTPADCAHELLELAPPLMQFIRQGMRSGRDDSLTVAQFRTLIAVEHLPGSSLSDTATHVGLGAPAMSVLVDTLVRRKLLTRHSSADDRRRSELALTPSGRSMLARAQRTTRDALAGRLDELSPESLDAAVTVIRQLREAFASERPASSISATEKS